MLALSIRQPYAEMILRGMKTVEHRSVSTRHLDTRFYIYAPKKTAEPPAVVVRQLSPAPTSRRGRRGRGLARAPKWIDELWGGGLETLPTGVIVGSAVITECRPVTDGYQWLLAEVRRLKRPRTPANKPQPVWFHPF